METNITEKSPSQKYKDGEISRGEYNKFLCLPRKESMWRKWKDGKITQKEYDDWWTQQLGFKDKKEYDRNFNHITGKHISMSENKECSNYLGIYITERILSYVFESATQMPFGNKGFDWLCPKGLKIDVKSACLGKHGNTPAWRFGINKNKIADYFLLLAFDNRTDLNPMHIWLIKGTDICDGYKRNFINEKSSLEIYNTKNSINRYKKYELDDKIERVIKCYDKFKNDEFKNQIEVYPSGTSKK